MTRVGILGDTHGNLAAARFMLWSMHKMGITSVIQVGDFGLYTDNNGMKFARKVSDLCVMWGIELWVVPGNHENHRVINELLGEDRTARKEYRPNVYVLPRGYRWEWDGMSFLALGGAPSVDRITRLAWETGRKPGNANKYWYAEEQITDADVDYTVSGGYADVMIGHDAPHGIQGIERVIRGNPHGFHVADLLYAEEGRLRMTEAFRGVAPEFFFHGHYHTPVNENIQRPGGEYGDITHVIGLDCEFNNYSMATIDTETRTATNIDHDKLLAEFRDELNGRPWPKN